LKDLVLSYSGASKYSECPFAWKCHYIDKLPQKPKHFFSFGKSLHSAVESFHIGLAVPSVEDVLLVLRESWEREGYSSANHEKEMWGEAVSIVRGYHSKHSADPRRALHVEFEFLVDMGHGMKVRGFIDRIDRIDKGYVGLLDYKTGKAFRPGRLESDKQLTTYQMALESLDHRVGRLALYHLSSLTEFPVGPRTTAQVREVRDWFLSTAEDIRSGKFDPDPGDRKCGWCDYRLACPIFKKA